MKIDRDFKERIQTTLLFVVEFAKVSMGTFLVIFVPRKCENDSCLIKDNLTENSSLHFIALISNAITFAFFVYFYFVEMVRENFCIENLDVNDEKPLDFLDDEIEKYPKIKKQMIYHNKKYLIVGKFLIFFNFSNVAVSLADLANSWNGNASLTPLFSYVLLISQKLATSIKTARDAIRHEKALSAYSRTPVVYNDIDQDKKL